MPATTLYLVRHAEADGHEDSDDPDLSPLGKRQAAAVGTRLKGVGATELQHSSTRRAIETATIIAESLQGVRVVRSAAADDLTPIPEDWSEIPSRYHDFLRTVPDAERDPGARRLDHAIAQLSRIGDVDRTIVVVTHNFVIGWFVRHALDAPRWRWIGLNHANCGISIIRWETGQPHRLVAFNDVGHLPVL